MWPRGQSVVSIREQRRGEQASTHQFTVCFLVWARQTLTLPWCLSFPLHSCLFKDEWFLQMGRSMGLQRGLETSATVCHLSGKPSHFSDPFPRAWSLLTYQPGGWERVQASPGTSYLSDLRWCEHPPSPCEIPAPVPGSLMDGGHSPPGDAHC